MTSDPIVKDTSIETKRIANEVSEDLDVAFNELEKVGRAWARYGLSVGRLAVETSGSTYNCQDPKVDYYGSAGAVVRFAGSGAPSSVCRNATRSPSCCALSARGISSLVPTKPPGSPPTL